MNKKITIAKYPNGLIKTEKIITDNSCMIVEYFESGKIKFQEPILNDKRHGTYVKYWENGHPSDRTVYTQGLEDGKSTLYNEKGQIWLEGQYKSGKQVGKWLFHNEDGEVSRVEKYDENGNLIT